MSLADGGHLTMDLMLIFQVRFILHINMESMKMDMDYEALRTLAHTHQPKLIAAGFSAYSRILDWLNQRNCR